MFTIEQIKAEHSKVKTGADFPVYIQDIKKLGVVSYATFVSDGHVDYFGANGFKTTSPSRYVVQQVADKSISDQFKADLKAHQQGKSDYPTFCKQAADSGVEKWIVSIDKMTCSYFDKNGAEMLVEQIPDSKK